MDDIELLPVEGPGQAEVNARGVAQNRLVDFRHDGFRQGKFSVLQCRHNNRGGRRADFRPAKKQGWIGHEVNRQHHARQAEKRHEHEQENDPQGAFAPALQKIVKMMAGHAAKL